MDEFDPRPAVFDLSPAIGLLAEVGAPIVTWGGSTPWSREDAVRRLIRYVDHGGSWVARRPGEFASTDNAEPIAKRRWNMPMLGPAAAVAYLCFPHNPPRSAIAAFAEATISEMDAVRALGLPLSQVIERAERCELGGARIGGRWFLSRRDILRKATACFPLV
jgi:hypothetical protein